VRRFYENELGWTTVPGPSGAPVRLRTGVRFDVLDVPAGAGRAALRHLAPASPVALRADRMWLLVAEGSAEELPGLLDWLEWGALALDLTAIGAGGSVEAPPPPDPGVPVSPDPGAPASPGPFAPLPGGSGTRSGDRPGARPGERPSAGPRTRRDPGGAARWLRPPEPGREVEPALPTLSALGGGGVGGAPDLVRLVQTMATQCHRVRLRRACAQPLAFS